jgi:tetratricopeptide (TPR) repeat protein
MSDDEAPARSDWWSGRLLRWAFFFVAFLLLTWWRHSDDDFWKHAGEDLEIHELIDIGNTDLAIQVATRLIGERPESSMLRSGRGEAYRRKGDVDHALEDFDAAIKLNAENSDAYMQRCLLYHALRKDDQAIADCEMAKRTESNWQAQEAIASIQLARSDFDGAYDSLAALIKRQQPSERLPGPQFHRGRLSLFLYNRPGEAADDLAQASDYALERFKMSIEGALPATYSVNRILLPFTFVPDGMHLLVWNHIARLRAGQDDSKEFADHLDRMLTPIRAKLEQSIPAGKKFEGDLGVEAEKRAFGPWPGAILALFAGKTTPDAVRAAADGEADSQLKTRRGCEADFYLAEYLLTKGEQDNAIALLQSAADHCTDAVEEARLAKWELKRIRP